MILERGYRSLLGQAELQKMGFSPAQQRAPGILVPLWGVDGQEAGHQFRPDNPRSDPRGRPVKYESPRGAANHLDCPPRCQKTLGDPQVPLWVTEGSKKADALASKGACAISITGVWGFKGKNAQGGITFLADWDYVSLKGRQVYLAFDSDAAIKDLVRQALEHLAEHLRRKGAQALVIRLPQPDVEKVGIDDYLLEHSLEDALKLASDVAIPQSQRPERSVPGFVLSDGTVGEMVVGDDDERAFIVAGSGSVSRIRQYQAGKTIYVPTADPLVGQVIHFATTARPYDSQAVLFAQVRTFIHHYVELPADFEEIAALYVLLTWVYEFAPSIPYLRVIGDWGSGKTRFLDVVGRICFRPIFASGATTPSPVFRILDKFQGTLVLDEADFKESSAWVEMIKILNNGYRPGFPVLRAEKDDGKWYPQGFQVFGPKLLSTRFPFKDEALESRCLTAEMMPLTRQEIPRVLPPAFQSEVLELRSRLLTFRLANLLKLRGMTFGNELLEPNLQPRLQEILIPLKAMINGDQPMTEALKAFVHRLQDTLLVRRRETPAGRVLAAMMELHSEGAELTAKSIAEKVNALGDEAVLSAEKVGRVTRKLGFEKNRTKKSRAIIWEEGRMTRLAALYGIAKPCPISQVEPSQPSLLSPPNTNRGDSNGRNAPNAAHTVTAWPDAAEHGGDSSDSSSRVGARTDTGRWEALDRELDQFLSPEGGQHD